MITDGNKCHYLAVSNLSALRSKKSQNHNGDLYCFGCFNSYTTKNRLTEHEEICNKHDSCRIEMSKLAEKILKYAHGKKITESSICNLSWFRMFTKKGTILSE